MKAYHREEGYYSGLPTENFYRNILLFNERSDQCGISKKEKPCVLSIMRKDRASKCQSDSPQNKGLMCNELVFPVRKCFITAKPTRAQIREWASTTFENSIKKNWGRKTTDWLQLLVNKLQDLQSSLPTAYKSEDILYNKTLNEVKDVEAYKLSHFKPADKVSGLIDNLHSAISTSSCEKHSSAVDAMFVEKKFMSKTKWNNRKRNCFVSHHENCWSTSPDTTERLRTLQWH